MRSLLLVLLLALAGCVDTDPAVDDEAPQEAAPDLNPANWTASRGGGNFDFHYRAEPVPNVTVGNTLNECSTTPELTLEDGHTRALIVRMEWSPASTVMSFHIPGPALRSQEDSGPGWRQVIYGDEEGVPQGTYRVVRDLPENEAIQNGEYGFVMVAVPYGVDVANVDTAATQRLVQGCV